jgi:hypothetical protein
MVTSASNRERGVSIAHNQAPELRVFVVGGTDGHTPLDQGHPPRTPTSTLTHTTRTWTLARTAPETLEP